MQGVGLFMCRQKVSYFFTVIFFNLNSFRLHKNIEFILLILILHGAKMLWLGHLDVKFVSYSGFFVET